MKSNSINAAEKLHNLIVSADWTGQSAYEYLLHIKKKSDLNALRQYRDTHNNTLLHFTTSRLDKDYEPYYYYKLSILLIEKGVPIDTKSCYSITPLFNCIRDKARLEEGPGRSNLAKLLIDKGADFAFLAHNCYENQRLEIADYYLKSLHSGNIEREWQLLLGCKAPDSFVSQFTTIKEQIFLNKNIHESGAPQKTLKI